jgi:integrase/recombinase XerD
LLTFAQRTGYLPLNVGTALRVPPVRNVLAERILDEADVIRLIALEPDPRNHPSCGSATSPGCGSRNCAACAGAIAAAAALAGKSPCSARAARCASSCCRRACGASWRPFDRLRAQDGEAADDDPVFRSAKGGALDPSAIHRIVEAAAARAGLPRAVSAHYLRHAHVSYALDRGAPAHLVQATVGHSDLRTTSRYAHARPNESSAPGSARVRPRAAATFSNCCAPRVKPVG